MAKQDLKTPSKRTIPLALTPDEARVLFRALASREAVSDHEIRNSIATKMFASNRDRIVKSHGHDLRKMKLVKQLAIKEWGLTGLPKASMPKFTIHQAAK